MTLQLVVPPHLEAHEPPEARGIARDHVKLMTSFARNDSIVHTRFDSLPEYLRRGDVVVVNTSATLNAALNGTRANGEAVEVHLSQLLGDDVWVIELRRPTANGTVPLLDATARPGEPWTRPAEPANLDAGGPPASGEIVTLPGDATLQLLAPYREGHTRLWRALLRGVADFIAYTAQFGFPIRYGYVPQQWPLEYYQTIFAREPGSAEMPSAGRAFTQPVLDALKAKGVRIVPVLLHTGVSSPEAHEPPYAEYFRVTPEAAAEINEARKYGGRVVAIGTTVVRALESVAKPDGVIEAGSGWTDLVITTARGIYAVDALLTGFHEPAASHLSMLEALAGEKHIERTYSAAVGEGYLWHEFGDMHLIFSPAVEPPGIDRMGGARKFRCNERYFERELAGHDHA